jgi:hypothetical protein
LSKSMQENENTWDVSSSVEYGFEIRSTVFWSGE